MSDHPYIDIPIEGRTIEEVLDAISKAQEVVDPRWWPELRLLAGRLREPFATMQYDDVGRQIVVEDVPGRYASARGACRMNRRICEQ